MMFLAKAITPLALGTQLQNRRLPLYIPTPEFGILTVIYAIMCWRSAYLADARNESICVQSECEMTILCGLARLVVWCVLLLNLWITCALVGTSVLPAATFDHRRSLFNENGCGWLVVCDGTI